MAAKRELKVNLTLTIDNLGDASAGGSPSP